MRSLFDKVNNMNYYISMRITGKPNEFAEKLNISRSTLFEYLNLLKRYGAPIEYNPLIQSYYYTDGGNFEIKFVKF
jgi:hypothetical protein